MDGDQGGIRFEQVMRSEDDLRAVLGQPSERVRRKAIQVLDRHCRAFIERSPFVLIASSDAAGNCDVSPKGDPAGFVQVLDERTLAIPDRPGNKRLDTFLNVIANPRVGLIFLVPGNRETLRVNGRAEIVRDQVLRDRLAMNGKAPDFALVVRVDEAYLHCAKCVVRAKLWDPAGWPDLAGMPTLAQAIVDHAKLAEDPDQVQQGYEEAVKRTLY